jgi:ABC-type branched-subunit amino acid transport system substrate-binding protein
MPRFARTRQGGVALLAAVALSTVAACSSAPAPTALEQNGGSTDGATPTGPSSAGPTGATVPGATAAAVPGTATTVTRADGTKVTTVTRADGTKVVTVTKNGKSTTTTTTSGGGGGGTAAAPARSTLFTPAEDKIGISDSAITLCGHAALIFGKAFNARPQDLDVFFRAMNAEKGGAYGRKILLTLEDDQYSATAAVTAARACKAKNPFILLGGIGFDQIPAVRNYVEAEHILYMHHTATVKGSQGLKYSFTSLPTVERTGEAFAQLFLSKYKGKKLGIIKRDGPNWETGVVAFKAYAASRGVEIVAEAKVADKKANYTDEILAMKNAGAEVVWVWENALASTQIVGQAEGQKFRPRWLMFPFNLTTQTLQKADSKPPMDGVAMYTAYSQGDYAGPFAQYADDVKQFEEHYRKYDSDADLKGVAGDLLFLNWQAQKALYDMLLTCGKDCTRNRFVDVLTAYKKRPSSSVCPIDFTGGDRHHGSDQLVFMETYDSPSGMFNWRNTRMCVGPG